MRLIYIRGSENSKDGEVTPNGRGYMVLKLICMFKIHVLIICTMIIKEMMPHHLLKILIRFLAFLVNKMNLMFWQLCVCVCVCVCELSAESCLHRTCELAHIPNPSSIYRKDFLPTVSKLCILHRS